MTDRPRLTDESVLSRWIGIEITRMNEGIVRDRQPLSVLLSNDTPAATTRKGDPHYFNKKVITMPGGKIPREMHAQLRLPILFFASPGVADSFLCTDETASAPDPE